MKVLTDVEHYKHQLKENERVSRGDTLGEKHSSYRGWQRLKGLWLA